MQNKKPAFKTPKGTAMYPYLNTPDTQFDTNGQYKVNIRMSKDEAKAFVDEVKQVANDAFGDKAKTAKLPFKTDQDTGDLIVITKSKFQPKFVDASGATVMASNLPHVHGGSTIKAAGNMYAYNAGGSHGISLQLGAVQLIQLSESSNGADISFDAEEGGFVASNQNEAAQASGDGYDF